MRVDQAPCSRFTMKRISLLSPLLLILSSLLSLFSSASIIVSPGQVLLPLLVFWILLILLGFPIMYKLTNDWDLSGIFLSLLIVTLFFTPVSFRSVGIIFLVVFLTWVCLSFFIKWVRQKRILALFFSFTSLILVIFQVFSLAQTFARSPLNVYFQSGASESKISLTPSQKPDIYYIVLDGYARADILKDYYHFDNTKFISDLNSRGFITPQNVHSNYPKTAVSIASTLNMDYVQNFAPGLSASDYWWLMTPYIDHSRLREALEKEGYETYAVATDWGITDNQTVDHYYKPTPLVLSDFDGYLFNTTPMGYLGKLLLSPFSFAPSFKAHRAFIENDFQALSNISKLDGPKFVFAHIISPHPPFVFDEQGNSLTPNYTFSFADGKDYPGTSEQYRSHYVGQVNFVNDQLEKLVDNILSNSKTPPIIVLQADHGPGMFTNFSSAEETCMRERFSIFGAYYFPGLDATQVPSDLTPVNTFRIVLNGYFNANLPLLENASYFYHGTNTIFDFLDVSSRIHEACTPSE